MTKWKPTKCQTMIYTSLHRKLNIEQHESHYYINTGDEFMFSWRVSSSCSTSGTCRAKYYCNMSRKGKNQIVIAANGIRGHL
jgi:hypothetical protein